KADGSQDFELDVTGTLETLEGGIILNPGDNGVVWGDLIARGAGADIVINAKDTLELRGDLLAQDDIIITAGTTVKAGEVSIYTHGTSHFNTIDSDGVISITGLNNVDINSAIGVDSPLLRSLQITSTEGALWIIGKEYTLHGVTIQGAGNIQTAGELLLSGKNVDIEGIVRSTRFTAAAYDNEIMVDATGAVVIHGDLSLAGSLLVSAGDDVSIHNTSLIAGSGQRITINSAGDLLLGDAALTASSTNPMAATISADRLVEFNIGGQMIVAADALVFSEAADSKINIVADKLAVMGSLRAGYKYDVTSGSVWSGNNGTVSISTDEAVIIGGQGLDVTNNYITVTVGGTIASTGSVSISAGKDALGVGITLSEKSAVLVDATGTVGSLKLAAVGDILILGVVESKDPGSDVSILSDSLVFVDGFVKANDELTIHGGTDTTGIGILVTPVILDALGTTRVSGGTLDTAAGGKIHLSAIDSIFLQGVIGQMTKPSTEYIANVAALDVISTAKSVTVSGSVDIGDSVIVTAKDINVFEGGRIFVRTMTSTMFLNATGTVYLAPDSDPVVNPPSAAILRANGLLHILSSTIRVDGIIDNILGSTGRILLNSVVATTLTGAIDSKGSGSIDINSGVSRDWTLDVLTGVIDRTKLGNGSITISKSGTLTAVGSVNLKAGGDININADNSGTATAAFVIPVITTGTRTIEIITGYTQVYAGTHTENDIKITKTLITEQTGTEEVVVGHKNYRMDVTLEQIGYYNPNAPDGAKFREVLVEGIDYFNDLIDWTKAGSEALPARTATAVTGNYKLAGYREFQALNDAQKQAVLNNTGYMALYQFDYGTTINGTTYAHQVSLEQTINGTPTTNHVDPLWKNNAEKIYRIEVAGWKDKYIVMPEGANEDILNVISQGEALYLADDPNRTDGTSAGGTWLSATAMAGHTAGEYIGRYQDEADIDYTQDKSRFNNTSTTLGVETDLTGKNAYSGAVITDDAALEAMWNSKTSSADSDTDNARWAVTYNKEAVNSTAAYTNAAQGTGTRSTANVDGSGFRKYEIANELDAINQAAARATDRNRDPNWQWTTSGLVDVTDPQGIKTRYTSDIWVDGVLKSDLSNNTQSLVKIDETTRTAANVGNFSYWTNPYGFGGADRFDNDGWNDDPDEGDLKRGGYEVYNSSWDDTVNWHKHFGSSSTAPIGQRTADHQISLKGVLDWDYIALGPAKNYYHNLYWYWQDKIKVTIDETQHDYTYDWTSNWHDIYDTRIKLGYQLVTQSTDIYDYRAIYATTEQTIVTLTPRDVTDWDTVPVITTETQTWTEKDNDNSSTLGAYGSNSIHAGTITIDSGKNSTISGSVISTGVLTASAVDTLTVKGSVRSDGKTMLSYVEAKDSVNLNAGANLNLSGSSQIKTTEAATSDIILTSKQGITLAGFVEAGDTISIAAARDISLGGSITALNNVSVSAGDASQGNVKDGTITSGNYLDLKVTAASGDVSISAGSVGGNIALTNNALVTAPDLVTLTATSGKISHADGFITATTLTVGSANGFSAVTMAANLNVAISDVGDIDISSARAVTLADLSAKDGFITVKALGDIIATKVNTLGATDRNDITLAALSTQGSAASAITLINVATGGLGDIALTSQGMVAQTSGVLTADVLTVSAIGGVTLRTDVSSLSIETKAVGNVTVTQSAKNMTVDNVTVVKGNFTLTASGAVDLAEVVLSSNSDANDIVVTAAGNIGVRHIVAGVYATSDADFGTAKDGSGNTIVSVSSLGDITLTSTGGKIEETFSDAEVDLVADTLTLSAFSGILGMEIAVNDIISATTASGDIWLRDFDGYKEWNRSLGVGTITTAKNSSTTVTIEAQNNLLVGASSLLRGGTIKLISDLENVQVLKPTGWSSITPDSNNSLDYSNGISFKAAKVIDLYRFFNAPDLIEYRAGDYFQFGGAATSTGITKLIPTANLTSKSIIIETGDVISINGTLTASDYLELNSARNVTVKGDIVAGDGNIDKVVIIARGEKTIDISTFDPATNTYPITSQASGFINIQASGIDSNNFEIRAKNDISINLQSDLTISGYIGGVSGFDKARDITIQLVEKLMDNPETVAVENTAGVTYDVIAHTLSITGGIVAAQRDMFLKAGNFASDSSSVFIATNLDVLAKNAMLLNTLVTTIDATSMVSGDVTINEADDLIINLVSAYNGAVSVTAGGKMTANRVETVKDGSANSIVLNAGKNIEIGYIEAATASGAQKTTATVTVDAAGLLVELADAALNDVDIFAYAITLRDSSGSPAYTVINDPTDTGDAAKLEVAFTKVGTSGVTTGTTTIDQGNANSSGGGVVPATSVTVTPAGTDARQISEVVFANILDSDLASSPAYRYTLTLTAGGVQTVYVVEAGFGGVTNTWASVLAAFETGIEAAGSSPDKIAVTVVAAQRKLILESVDVNKSFTVDLVQVEKMESGDVTNAVAVTGAVIQSPGISVKQVSDIVFAGNALTAGDMVTVVVNDHNYSARVGDNEIIFVTGVPATTQITVNAQQWAPIPGIAAVTPNSADIADPAFDRTVDFSSISVVTGATYSVTVGNSPAVTHVATGSETMVEIVADLVGKINGGTYTAVVNGANNKQIDITNGAGTFAILVSANNGVTGSAVINAADIADPNFDRTINLTGVTVETGGIYKATINGTVCSYTALASDNTIAKIATGLAADITAKGFTAASSGTNTITITSNAGIVPIVVSGLYLVPISALDQVVVGNTTEAGRTINLSSLTAVDGGIYTINIGGVVKTYTALAGNTLANIADGLKTAIGATATVYSQTVGNAWNSAVSVLTGLDYLIEAGEAVTGTPTAGSYSLSLQANVADTPFTVGVVGVTSATVVTKNGSIPTVKAAAGVAQQSVIDFGNFSMPVGAVFTVVMDALPITVASVTTQEVAVQSTPTAAAPGVAQKTYLTYLVLDSTNIYTAMVGDNPYTVNVGKVVNGVTVTTSWATILEALRFNVSAGEPELTVTVDEGNKRLVLTAKTTNSSFTATGSEVHILAKTWSAQLADLKSALENIPSGTNEQTARADVDTKQISELTFDNDPIATGYSYTVTVGATDYTATVGVAGVSADWSSILGKIVSMITADGSAVVTAAADANNFKLTLTAKVVNTPFSSDHTVGKVTVAADDVNHTLTLTSKATNTPFSIDAVTVTLQGAVAKSGAIPTTEAGVSITQISDVVFDTSVPVTVGYSYTVTIDDIPYTTTVGQAGVTASALSVLTKLKSLIDAGATTATIDDVNFKLTLTADTPNTAFTINAVTVTQSITSTVTNGGAATTSQTAGSSVKQVSAVTFGGSPSSGYDYKVTINGATYTATGSDWTTVLNALKTQIDAGATTATITDTASGGLTLTADTANTPFTFSAMAINRSAASSLTFTGDKVLVLPDRSVAGVFGASATGTLTVVNLPTFAGDVITLTAGKDLVVVSPIGKVDQVCSLVALTAGEGLTLGDKVTANTLNLTAKNDVSINTAVQNLVVNMTGNGDFTVIQTGVLNLGSLNMNGGDLTIVADGDITITSLTGTIGTISITSKTGKINIISNTATATAVTLNAATSISGQIEADTLDMIAGGAIDIVEADGVVINTMESTSDAALTVLSKGNMTINGAITAAGSNTVTLTTTAGGAINLNQAITTNSGNVTITAANGMIFSGQADITSTSGNVTLNAGSGALTMTGETIVNAGSGIIGINAGTNITLGKLITTSSNDLVITSNAGAVLDSSDGFADITATGARLVINAATGVGSGIYGAIETDVAKLRVVNSNVASSGAVAIEDVNALEIENIDQRGAGAVSIRTLNGPIIVSTDGIAAKTGAVTLYAGGQTGSHFDLDAYIKTSGGSVYITTDSGDITFKQGIEITGIGSITLQSPQG
ncbi:MAG: hypothetical protein WC156_06130, partial [Pedobacter sp.]